jgi:hypothetical protein
MISSHVVKGATSAATFSLLVQIGGRKEVALVNNVVQILSLTTHLSAKQVAMSYQCLT